MPDKANPYSQLTAEIVAQRHDFLRHAYRALGPGEMGLLAHRNGSGGFDPTPWIPGAPFLPIGEHYNSWAFRKGSTRALADNATRAHIVMLDDIGNMPGKSACPLERVLLLPLTGQPHVVVVTRASNLGINCQAVWFLQPCDLDDARDLVKAALIAGWGDPAAHASVRWARPPASIKAGDNSYVARLLRNEMTAPRVEVDALARILGVPGFRNERAARTLRSSAPQGRNLPDAETVRSALGAIPNDDSVDRDRWFRICMAIKASCGEPPALNEDEGFALFDEWSRTHGTYRSDLTVKAWNSAPAGKVSFGSLVFEARKFGWGISEEQLRSFAAFDAKYSNYKS